MASKLADAHIAGQKRLRTIATAVVARAWQGLGAWDEEDVPSFLDAALPTVLAAQRQSVALTEAFLARSLGRAPLGVDAEALIGAAVRGGTPPETVYRRPFVQLWSALKDGRQFDDALRGAGARAEATAAMDVQLASRATFQAVQDADGGIYGYQRIASSGACAFCQEVDGAYLKFADASPLHNNCSCSLAPLTEPHPRARFLPSGIEVKREGFAIHTHGELGAVIGDPSHAFTSEGDF